MLKSVMIDASSGKILEVLDDIYGNPTLLVTDHYVYSTRFKSETRSVGGTTEITSPETDGAIMLTDMIVSTDRVAVSRVTIFFDDGIRQINIYDGYANDAPINFAIGFHGGWKGWKNAVLKMTTVAAIHATVAVGYIKLPVGLEYREWDALR